MMCIPTPLKTDQYLCLAVAFTSPLRSFIPCLRVITLPQSTDSRDECWYLGRKVFGYLNRLHFPFRAGDIRSHLRLSTHVDGEARGRATSMWWSRCTKHHSYRENGLHSASCPGIVCAAKQLVMTIYSYLDARMSTGVKFCPSPLSITGLITCQPVNTLFTPSAMN